MHFGKKRQKENFSLFITSFIPLIVSKENLPKENVLLLKLLFELVPKLNNFGKTKYRFGSIPLADFWYQKSGPFLSSKTFDSQMFLKTKCLSIFGPCILKNN
jgi:hypothetical protein